MVYILQGYVYLRLAILWHLDGKPIWYKKIHFSSPKMQCGILYTLVIFHTSNLYTYISTCEVFGIADMKLVEQQLGRGQFFIKNPSLKLEMF